MYCSVSRPRGHFRPRPHCFNQSYWSSPSVYRMDLEDLDNLLTPLQLISALTTPEFPRLCRKREGQQQQPQKEEEEAQKKEEELAKKAKWEVQMKAEGFKPNELSVKLVDNQLIVSGQHEHEDESGSVSRNFTKKWTLPEDVLMEEMACTFKDGDIVISAPRKVEVPTPKEKLLQIHVEGKASTNPLPEDNKGQEEEKLQGAPAKEESEKVEMEA